MNDMLEVIFLFFALFILTIIIVFIFIHLYQIFEEPAIRGRMRTLRKAKQPWVTILLYTRNNKDTIENSLKSVLKSKYHNFDIVIVDDRSQDDSSRIVKNFITAHPGLSIGLLKRRTKSSSAEALKAGYRKSKRGEIVISMTGDTIIDPSFIKRAVATKNENNKIVLKQRGAHSIDSFDGIIKTLGDFFWQRTQKIQVSNVKGIKNIGHQMRYDLIGVVTFIFLVFASFALQETVIIWYGWLIVTSYLCAVIWLEKQKVSTKIKLTFSALSALFLLPVTSFVMTFSQLNSRK